MRKAVAAMILAVGLCGCSDIDSFFGADSGDATPAPAADSGGSAAEPVAAAPVASAAPVSAVAPSATATSKHCATLARQRASDAAYQGEDEETQEQVYNRTLATCADWDRRHAL